MYKRERISKLLIIPLTFRDAP